MAMSRYTQLLPFISGHGDIFRKVSAHWQLDVQSLPTDVLVHSWATLLRAFTGDESPVFALNGKPVKANLSSRAIEFVELEVPSDLSERATSIFIDSPSALSQIPDRYALSLDFNSTTGLGTLLSTWGVDEAFLLQIGRQLKEIIQKQASSRGVEVNLPPTEAPEMSISNGSPSILPGPQLLHELALGGSKGSVSAIEFLSADGTVKTLSYTSLDSLSTKLASQITGVLAPLQIDPTQNVIIPVLLPQSMDLYVSYLGILKAGAAFCPLNLDTPFDRIHFILQDVAASIVITKASLSERLPKNEQLTVIMIDNLDSTEDSASLPWRSCLPSHLAYVMYTSGSEGRPKGVGLSHLAATQSLLAHQDLIPKFQRYLQFASPTFDVSVFEYFFPLMRNATVIACDRETLLRDISGVIRKMNVDAGELTPTVAGELLRTRAAAPSLRVLLTIGEMLTRHVVDEFGQSETSQGMLYGMYGPTEAAIHCTAAPNIQAQSRVNQIGYPFKTVSAYVASLDPADNIPGQEPRILPRGQIGELVVGGSQLADGYLNRPEENKKAFIQSPSYGRLYRTGDKARMLPSGELECFGRVSAGQVKLRGQRIELGEIEHVVCMAANARSTVAIVTNGILVAFLLVGDTTASDTELRQACRQWLPRFMVPGEFILVDRFPQLPSGKVDRKALESEYLRSKKSEQPSEHKMFRDVTEEAISSCITKVLRTSVSATESLAAAGLDSLAAIRLASCLREIGLNLEVGKLLEADSVDGIYNLAKAPCASLSSARKTAELGRIWNSVVTASSSRLQSIGLDSEISGVEPCSHIQQSMIAETVRNAKAYCNFVELEFFAQTQFTDVKDALCKLAQQNDIMRSGFIEIGLKNFPYGRFVWNELKDRIFQKCERFDYELSLGDEYGILYPMRVQYREERGKLRVLLNLHHAIYDGWSWDLIRGDLEAALTGKDFIQRPPYKDITSFFIESAISDSTSESSTYWQDQLYGMSPTMWPNFNPTTDVPCGRDVATRVLDAPLAKLDEISKQLRVSRQAIFQAAVGYLLSSYFGADDVVFGTVFSGRTLPIQGIESIIGPCIQVLPMRLNLEKVQNVGDLILAAHNLNRKSLDHGNIPLHDIKRASGVDLNLRLFDTAIVWQETIWSDKEGDTIVKEIAAADYLEFALLLELEPKGGNICVKATYQRSVLPLRQVEILLEQIDHVTSVFIDNPDLPINNICHRLPLSLLSVQNPDYERQVDLPSLASAVEDIASTDPNRLAVEFLHSLNPENNLMDIEGVTYEQLNRQANRLAHHLVDLGVRKNDLIGVLMDKSIELYISILAVLKIGAGYIPIKPQSPTQKVHSILIESRAQICITNSVVQQEHALDSLEFLRALTLDENDSQTYSDCNLPVFNEGSAVAYVIFTSGSTGKPKGVLVPHSCVQSNIAVLTDLYPSACGSKMLQACSHAFDVSVFEILFAWRTGMTLCATTNDTLFRDIQLVIRSMGVTHLSLTPTVAALVNPQEVPGVQFLVTAGEALTEKVHQTWAGKGLYQGYGPCETTNICTVFPNVEAWHSPRNLGPPLKNCSAFILLEHDEFCLAPRGGVGELCIGGDQVAQGYLNMPDLTARRFISHPQYGRLYRSGDFARFLPDGSIHFIGRRDDQVKLRGQRVELGEINNVLLSSKAAKDCASIILENGKGPHKLLVVFWVPSASLSDVSAQDAQVTRNLFEKLRKTLPGYMIPSHLIPIDALPMTENGKADHARLLQKFQQIPLDKLQIFSPDFDTGDAAEYSSQLERDVATILSDVTDTDLQDIRANTSFYHVGLDSISAISFSRKLREAGFGQLDVSTILRQSSVSRLSAVISSRNNKHVPRNDASMEFKDIFGDDFIQRTKEEFAETGKSVQAIYPCTPLQEAMLSAEVSQSRSAYFNHLLFEVHVDFGRLQEVWCKMLERHAILKTCFKATNNAQFAYAQVVLGNATLPFHYIDISGCQLDTQVHKQKLQFQDQFQVSGALPYSLTFFRDHTRRKSFLFFSIHHALYDGEAIGQMFQEVQSIFYSQPVAEIVPFEHFIRHMLSADVDISDSYWDHYLLSVSPSLLSGFKADDSVNTAPFQSHIDLRIPYDLFKMKCRDALVTPLSAFHTAWAKLLSLYLDSSDVCFGNVASCRTIPLEGADRIVGPCFNTLPVRVKFTSTATNEDIMRLSTRNNSEMLLHQLTPLRHIQKRSLGDGSQLFDTLVILQTRPYDLDGKLWKLISEEGNMEFPFICEITPDEKQNNVHICLHSRESCISPADGELIVRQFAALVEHTIQYPSGQASDKRPAGNEVPFLPRKVSGRARKFVSLAPASAQASRPWSQQELEIRDILCSFAKVDKGSVSQDTTIFQLGLDSINAVQIAGYLCDLGYNTSAGSLLEAATISNISALLDSNDQDTEEDSFDFPSFENQYLRSTCQQLQIREETVECIRPCTPVQNGMLAMFSNSNGKMYFNRIALAQSVPLDTMRLKEAWLKVMAKHEMLRTGFIQLQDQKHPFAMITYREGVSDLPWFDAASSSLDTPLPQHAENILKNLHLPPWYLISEGSDSTTTLQFSAHHAIYDAQSLHLILADVASAYKGAGLSSAPSINATLGPILTESLIKSDEAESFWREMSKDVQPTKFPDLHPFRMEKRELLVSSKLCKKPRKALEDGCQVIGTTLQAAGQAAWARLLSAYIGEPNVVFGVVYSGRNLSTTAQEAAFPCLVTVPSPCRVVGTNRELLESILKQNASLVKYQFTPLSKVQRWLRADEGLFDTLFVYQKFSSQKKAAEDWKIVEEDARIDYPISIEMIPHATELELRLTHRSDIVPVEQATLLLEQLHCLLEDSIFSPNSSSIDYSSLGAGLLAITPAHEERIPCSVSLLHQFVENNAALIPSKTAFEFAWDITEQNIRKRTWTYNDLNGDGNKIARLLQSKGAVPGSMIAICFDKCQEASLGILGIMKSGCAYVAIDPNAPIARKQFILDDSDSKLLLCTQSGKAEMSSLSGVELITLDEPGLLDGLSTADPILLRPIRPDDTCYCLYTSGTTGAPKGCEITHENAVQAMLAFQRLFDGHWDSESRWLQFASFHFDVSVLEQYWSWSVGICVTSCPRDLLFEDLPGTINRLQITHIDLTPSLARLVHPDEVPSLCKGVFITGGEQLKQEILDSWGKHGVIYNGYGPTEVTIGCTMLPRVPVNGKPSNIGPQFDNVGSYVLVPGTSTPVLRGGVGELCVSGVLVGRGYLNRPQLTKERFQFSNELGERIYRTGDLVRILHDGSFQFLGRIDDQVKLRGQRLEIGEINEVIRGATQELGEVATLVVKHPKQSREQLVSFVTRNTAKRKPPSAEVCFTQGDHEFLLDIKSACHSKLPGYMVPTHMIPMSHLPLSANNKVDMNVLKAIYQDLSVDEIQKLAPVGVEKRKCSPEERRIIALLSEFIEPTESEILPWTSIYELGLDSISVISFSRHLRDDGFAQSHPSLIMKNPTVAGMVSALRNPKGSSTPRTDLYENARQNIEAFGHKNLPSIIENLGISDTDVEMIAPCTPLQEGIIYRFLNSGKALYCSSFNFAFHGQCNFSKLKRAWSEAQRETQMLRVLFSATPDGYAQVVLRNCELPVFEVTVSSERDVEDVQQLKFNAWAANLGDLSSDLWMVWLINSPHKSVMCFNIFHALYDGMSLPLLLEKVARKYLEGGQMAEEPSFFDTLRMGPLCKDPSAEPFWKEHLKGALYGGVPKSNSADHHSVVQKIDIHDIEHVDKFRKSINVTEQAVLHACWLLTLHKEFSLVPQLGIVVSGRALDIPGIENVIGPLFNTIPSNINFRGIKTWSDLVQRCHDYHVSTIPFQHTPLRDIMKWMRRPPNQPLFDSLFVFRRPDSKGPEFARELWEELDSEAEHDYPLAFEVTRGDGESLTATIAVQDHVISSAIACELLTSFERHLHQLPQNAAQELPQTAVHADVEEDRERAPADDASQTTKKYSFQWTPQAINIRDVIADLAGIDKQSVGADTSIFEFGLDSIDAIKLSSRLKKLGTHLPVSVVMRHRTIRGMTQQLTSAASVAPNAPSSLEQLEKKLTEFLKREMKLPKDTFRILPATPIQEAMVAEMVASDYRHYYSHDVLKLEPHVDLEKLVEAWKAVVNANAILRTSFVEVWDPEIPVSYAQVVHDEGTLDVQRVELNGESVNTIIENQRAVIISKPAQLPLLTVCLAVDKDKRYLVLSMAHSLYDGWSMDMLHEDVARSYAGHYCQRPRYDDILEHIITSSGESATKFWRATLANFISAPFPKGQNAGNDEMVVHRQEKVFSHLPINANDFCKLHGVTMQALCVACWSLVLAGYVGKPDVAFGLVLSGRNTADSEHVMFPTMNTVVMRAILHGSRLEMVKYVQSTLVDLSEYQHFPLRKVKPDTGSGQLFDTLFIYQKRRPESASDVPVLYKSTGGSSAIEFPVSVELENVDESIVCRVACRDTVLGAMDSIRLLEHIEQVLSSILGEPNQQTVQFADGTMGVSGFSNTYEPSTNGTSEVDHEGIVSPTQAQTQWTRVELQIRKVLSIVADIPEEKISKGSTLFQLGLDSISAIKVSSLLKKKSIKLAVSDMIRAGPIGKMALAANRNLVEISPGDIRTTIEQLLNSIDTSSLVQTGGIDQSQVEAILPVTAGQAYFLSMNTLNPEVFYPIFYYLASEKVNPSMLDDAWARLTEKIPILRTAFVPTNLSHPPFIQVVMKTAQSSVIWDRELPGQMLLEHPRRSIHSVPLSLFASETPKGTILMLRVHHALYDGVSLPKIIEILEELYNNGSSKLQANVQLAPYIAFQGIHSPMNVRRSFWENYLGRQRNEGAPIFQDCYTGPIGNWYRPGLVSNMSRVEAIAKLEDLSVQSIFLAIYARIHAQICDSVQPRPDRMAIGLYLANRSYAMEGLSELIAPTVNIVPLRVDDKYGEDSLFAYARKIQGELNEISRVEHSEVSLMEISEWTGVQLDTCVNFLKIPEITEGSNVQIDGKPRLQIAPITVQDFQKLALQGEDHDEKLMVNSFVKESDTPKTDYAVISNGVAHGTCHSKTNAPINNTGGFTEVFKPTLDVEVAIRNDRLDFGIFGLRNRLPSTLAERVIERVRIEMGKLAEGDGERV